MLGRVAEVAAAGGKFDAGAFGGVPGGGGVGVPGAAGGVGFFEVGPELVEVGGLGVRGDQGGAAAPFGGAFGGGGEFVADPGRCPVQFAFPGVDPDAELPVANLGLGGAGVGEVEDSSGTGPPEVFSARRSRAQEWPVGPGTGLLSVTGQSALPRGARVLSQRGATVQGHDADLAMPAVTPTAASWVVPPLERLQDVRRVAARWCKDDPAATFQAAVEAAIGWVLTGGPAPVTRRTAAVAAAVVAAEVATIDAAEVRRTGRSTVTAALHGRIDAEPWTPIGPGPAVLPAVVTDPGWCGGAVTTCVWLLGWWATPPVPVPVRPPFTAAQYLAERLAAASDHARATPPAHVVDRMRRAAEAAVRLNTALTAYADGDPRVDLAAVRAALAENDRQDDGRRPPRLPLVHGPVPSWVARPQDAVELQHREAWATYAGNAADGWAGGVTAAFNWVLGGGAAPLTRREGAADFLPVLAEATTARYMLGNLPIGEGDLVGTWPDKIALLPPAVDDREWADGVGGACLWLLGYFADDGLVV